MTLNFSIFPVPEILKKDVECFCAIEHASEANFAIKVSPQSVSGIVFQHYNGRSAIESIITPSTCESSLPTLFLHGPGIEPSVMNFKEGTFTSIQVILKPHALNTLMGLNASTLTNKFVELNEFLTEDFNGRLIEANTTQKQISLLTDFLIIQLKQARTRDKLVEESLRLIHKNVAFISVKNLLERFNLSERQFERRFNQIVGIPPQSYIRVKRFNEAIRLIKSGRYQKLTDIAHVLNFYDQSHFIRDFKTFSGITPKSLSQREDDFHHPKTGYSYV